MPKHRRYPVKNTKKYRILNCEPQALNLSAIAAEDKSYDLPRLGSKQDRRNIRKNKAPSDLLLNDQPITRRQRELEELTTKVKQVEKMKRRRKPKFKDSLFVQAKELGYNRRPWEDPDRLVNRISRDTNKAINEELLKARFGTAGRDVKEIAKEYVELEQKIKHRRKKY